STGPVRAIAELTYEGWNAGGIPVTLRTRITQWAGDRGFFQTITADAPPGFIFATGLPLKGEAPALHSTKGRSWLGTWGEQVVMPGATATEPVRGSELGVGIVMIAPSMTTAVDYQQNHLLTFPGEHNSASWYTFAAWDEEGINDRTSLANNQEMQERSWLVTPHAGIRTKNQFAETMQRIAE